MKRHEQFVTVPTTSRTHAWLGTAWRAECVDCGWHGPDRNHPLQHQQ